jgi:glucose/arabinose dehydrogenase
VLNSRTNPKLWRNLWLAVAVAIILASAACSNQPADQASNPPASKPVKATDASKKPAPAQPPAAPVKVTQPQQPPAAPTKVTYPAQLVTVPKGTAITATVAQTLATDKNHPGDSFVARLATAVKVDGKVVIPKGAQVTGRVVTVKKHELKVALASVKLHGKSYDLATNSLRPSDKVQAKSTAKVSAAAQDNSSKNKKDKDATLPVQTQLTFKLAKPVTVPAKS